MGNGQSKCVSHRVKMEPQRADPTDACDLLSCSSRVAACSLSDAGPPAPPPDDAEPEPEPKPESLEVREGLMDEDGVFHGPDALYADHSLAEYLLRHLRLHAETDRVAQVCAESGDTLSFRTLLTETVRIATALTEDGFGVGDVVAFFSRNYVELSGAVLGCIMAGITVAALAPTRGAVELRQEMLLCSPKAIFVEAELLPKVDEALKDFPGDVTIFTLQPVHNACHVTSYRTLSQRGCSAAADPDTYSPAEILDRLNHVAFILYSSGTTGQPKAVQISNRGITTVSLYTKWLSSSANQAQQTCLAPAAISWSSGLANLLMTTEMGMRRITLPNPEPHTITSALQKYRVDLWMTAPFTLLTVVRDAPDLSHVKLIACGGFPLSAALQRQVSEKLKCPVVQGYGATEMALVLANTTGNSRDGALGRPQPLTAVRLVDVDTGGVVREVGRAGELRIRGPCTMIGYIGNPEGTAECYDDEGWFKTGDLMSFDEDGYFFFVDRLKQLIPFQLFRVAPAEVEAVLLNHPGVSDACVMGVPHQVDGEHPMAFVVRCNDNVTGEEVQAYIAERLPDHKHLRGGVIFLDSIPKTVSGKTQRPQLKIILKNHLAVAAEETSPNRV